MKNNNIVLLNTSNTLNGGGEEGDSNSKVLLECRKVSVIRGCNGMILDINEHRRL